MVEDAEIIATYERLESCRKVADALGIKSQEYVRRVLVKNGIKRTHRHDHEHQRLCNCNGKASLCAALVVMLRTVCKLRAKDISEATGYGYTSVTNIISRRGLQCEKYVYLLDVDIDAIEREYLAGASTYELGEKYGVSHQTISKWMKQRGHSRGNGFSNKSDEFKQWVAELHGSSFTVVNYENRRHVTIQCNICGHTFTRQARKSTSIRCPICYEHYMLENPPKHRHHGKSGNSLKRARKYGATIERGITLKKVFDRDDGICQICGCICDWSDTTPSSIGPKYPTIDHIIALANGGSHTWDNVQLAHHICNSKKRDFLEVSA